MNDNILINRDVVKIKGGGRNSNLELYRIVVMLLIVAHHYVVNSGVWDEMQTDMFSWRSQFLLMFGMWGKIGINCFVLITGYFMCTSKITWQKFLKLLLEIYFYKIVIYSIFIISGYEPFTIKELYKVILPVRSIGDNFTGCFLVFYLFIPFLTLLVNNLDEKMHRRLVILCLFTYTFIDFIPGGFVKMNYVSWFGVLFVIASYIRKYGIFKSFKHSAWGWLTLLSVLVSMASVDVALMLGKYLPSLPPYKFVADSNAIMAVITSVCSFMWFKGLNIKQSRLINIMGASTFGVLLIHANSDTMRRWLWRDLLDNAGHYSSDLIILHACVSVVVIFVICVAIDYARINLFEKPLFRHIEEIVERKNKV